MDLSAQRELARLLADAAPRRSPAKRPRRAPRAARQGDRLSRRRAGRRGAGLDGRRLEDRRHEGGDAEGAAHRPPIYGRVFFPFVKPSPVTVVHAKLASPIPEVEYQAKLGADLPPRDKPYTSGRGRPMPSPRCIPASNWRNAASSTTRRSRRCRPSWPTAQARARSSTVPRSTDWRTRDIAGQEATLSCRRQAAPQGHGRRRARPSDGAAHLARQRTVAHRRRPEGRADDQHRHADRHAGAQAGRDLRRGFRRRSAR